MPDKRQNDASTPGFWSQTHLGSHPSSDLEEARDGETGANMGSSVQGASGARSEDANVCAASGGLTGASFIGARFCAPAVLPSFQQDLDRLPRLYVLNDTSHRPLFPNKPA